MKTIGIFYGSSTGTTEGIAKRIAEKLGVEDKDIHDVSNASPADVAPYEIFCDAIGTIYSDLRNTGCKFIGAVDASGYSFDSSTACINGMFVGLPLDEMNEDDQTEGRIDQWLASIRKEGIE